LILVAVGTVGMGAALIVLRDGPAPRPVEPSTADLKEQLREPVLTLRRAASAKLAQLGTDAIAVLGPLQEALADPDPIVRAEVAQALARIGPPALAGLIDALDHPDVHVRRSAVHALGIMGPQAAPAVPKLVAALASEDEAVRMGAVRSLTQIGPAGIVALTSELRNGPSNGRAGAAEALGEIGRPLLNEAGGPMSKAMSP
jgi:HEAT repeat protein